jgi:hypothetical protein
MKRQYEAAKMDDGTWYVRDVESTLDGGEDGVVLQADSKQELIDLLAIILDDLEER